MMRTIIVLNLMVALVFASNGQANSGIVGWFTNNSEFQCSSDERSTMIMEATSKFNLGSSEYFLVNTPTNEPPTWNDLKSALSSNKDLLLDSHGGMEPGDRSSLFLEPYLDDVYALDAYMQYQEENDPSYFCFGGNFVGLTFDGISTLLAPESDPNGMKLIFACFSSFGRFAWGSFYDTEEGGSYFGYPVAIDNSIACSDLDIMMQALSCHNYDYDALENDILTAFNNSSYSGIFVGNENNAFNPQISCKSYAANFDAVGAWNGSIHWIASNEEKWSQYIIEGIDTIGDQPDTVAIVNGFGSDGSGVRRSYSVAAPGWKYLRVRELDNAFSITSSNWISWGEKPDSWALAAGEETTLGPIRVSADGSISNKNTNFLNQIHDIEPTDIMVYSTEDLTVDANRIRGSWQMTQDQNGNYFRARTWIGSEEPEEVRNLYRLVSQANQDYNANNPSRPYRDWPILQIVGDGRVRIADGDTLQLGPKAFWWTEGEQGGSGNGGWSSYSLMTDVDGDHIPEGPVVTIPAYEYSDVQIHANAVERWNIHGPSSNEVMLCLDDAAGGVSSSWMESRMFETFQDGYANQRGLQLKGVFRESDYISFGDMKTSRNQMTIDGTEAINSGVSEVWYTGLSAGAGTHTQFLEGVADWSRPQEFLLFGPSCQFGNTFDAFGHQIQKELFNTSGGIVVGGIGQLSASYYHSHRKLAILMQELLPQMAEESLLVDIAFEIQKEFMQRYPELWEYGLGIHCVGSIARLRGQSFSPVSGNSQTVLEGLHLRGIITGHGGSLKFNLPRETQVSLKIYDLKGRLVSTVLEGSLNGGEHRTTFSANRMASGVYLARLQAGNVSDTVKFSLIK